MSLKEFFPQYPFSMITPKKSKIKFGSHDIYVDLPWQTYVFFEDIRYKAEINNLTKEDVKKEWESYLQKEKKSLLFNNRPLVLISLRTDSLSKKISLRLDVKWPLFNKYLEEKSKDYLLLIHENGENILKFYSDSWINFFYAIQRLVPSKPDYSKYTAKRFKRLISKTQDYSKIKKMLMQLEELLNGIENMYKKNFPSIQLYTKNLLMNIKHLYSLIESINLTAAYMLLRNFLENYIKLFIYIDINISLKEFPFLDSMFLYEYESKLHQVHKQRIGSIRNFQTHVRKKAIKIISNTSPEDRQDVFYILNQLNKQCIIPLNINKITINEFSQTHNLNKLNLAELYSACSAIIHNQPPLPFFSLLEIKLFKNFLKEYVKSMKKMTIIVSNNYSLNSNNR